MNPLQSPPVIAESQVLWDDLAPTEHLIHLYADGRGFLGMLQGFVISGLRTNESVIVIATDEHLLALNSRLESFGFDLRELRSRSQYIDINAEAGLAAFMVNGWPDSQRFNVLVSGLLRRAGRDGRRVRAFGEMVALLWQKGNDGATKELERLWNELRETTPFPLLCAYPRSGFTKETDGAFNEICAAHTKIISDRAFPDGLSYSQLRRCV